MDEGFTQDSNRLYMTPGLTSHLWDLHLITFCFILVFFFTQIYKYLWIGLSSTRMGTYNFFRKARKGSFQLLNFSISFFRHIYRFNAVLLRQRFEENRNVLDMRQAKELLELGEEELLRNQHYQPMKCKGSIISIVLHVTLHLCLACVGFTFDISVFSSPVPTSPGGVAFEREVPSPDWVLDFWHPDEKAQYPDYFARREERKKEYVAMWEKKYGKHDPDAEHHWNWKSDSLPTRLAQSISLHMKACEVIIRSNPTLVNENIDCKKKHPLPRIQSKKI